jgi:SAM-dependent methyltransferase
MANRPDDSGWTWDDTLFAGTAAYYARGRLPYAPGLADALAELPRSDGRGRLLDGRGRLLDVGCGPGTLALALARLFGEIVGLDPDRGMIAEAAREAARRGVAGKTRWVRARAEELPAGLGEFTVATFGQSFHWMDRDLVAATMRRMLRPGGALLHISDLKTEDRTAGDLPHPAPPYAEIAELVGDYLGPVRRAGRGLLPQGTPGGEAAVFARAGFSGPQRLVVPGGQPLARSQDDVVAGVFSMSFSAPHLFGTRREAFEADLRRLLRAASPSGLYSELQPGTEVFVWRNSPEVPSVEGSGDRSVESPRHQTAPCRATATPGEAMTGDRQTRGSSRSSRRAK